MKQTAIVAFLAVICADVGSAELINTINFFGANPTHDAEAEYRLHQLGIDIVEAKRASTGVSLSMKHAYGASILGDIGTAHIENVDQQGQLLSEHWLRVAETSQQLQTWLEGKLRSDYSDAFCMVAKGETDLVGSLIESGASDYNQVWAFGNIGDLCRTYNVPEEAILSMFAELGLLATTNAKCIDDFLNELRHAQTKEAFIDRGLYGHIYEELAVDGEKPRIFLMDEIYFKELTRFTTYYEAVEQIARAAHTVNPGRHAEFRVFDLNFTD